VNAVAVGTCITATIGTGFILTSQSSLDAGLNLRVFANPIAVTVDASVSGTVAGDAIVTLAGTSAIANLTLGSGFGSSNIVEVNSAITVNGWNNNAGSAKVDNNCSSLVVGSLSVGGSSFAVFQSCPTATVTLQNIDFSARAAFTGAATLQIAGGVAHLGLSGSASGSITGTGTLALSGGVSVDGNIPQTVTINVATAGSSAPLVAIDAGAKLNISGDVQGSGGTIVVNGQFILDSTTASVNPKVVVNSGATLVINSATALTATAVDVSAQATLVIGANAKSSAVYVEKMTKCLGTVQINLATTASAFISGSSAGAGVGFTYSSNNVPADLANCAVQVLDSAGTTFTLTSRTSATVGRRLLASSGTATWGSNSMTYTMGQQQQASGAPSYFALLPIMVAGAVGLLV